MVALPRPLPAVVEEQHIVVEIVDDHAVTDVVHLPAARSNGWAQGGSTFDSFDFLPAAWPSACGAVKHGAVYIRAGLLENAKVCADCLAGSA